MFTTYSNSSIEQLDSLYKEINTVTDHLYKHHAERLKCTKGCSACCLDNLEVFGIEAAYIEHHAKDAIQQMVPKETGRCAFLGKEEECRIYAFRPLVCRTHGLPLRWIAEENKETVEYRDICELNEEGKPLEELENQECLSIMDFEERLAWIQFEADKGTGDRIQLRNLLPIKQS